MAQQGYIFKQGGSWFLRYRDNLSVDGQVVRKQKCVKLADYCDRYRCERDVQPLAGDVLARVRQSGKCSHAGIMFADYVKTVFLPMVQRIKKPSTYAAYRTYYQRYIAPFSEDYALCDFSISIVSGILESASRAYTLNAETLKKIRSVISAVFHHAITKGSYPARSATDNPASCAAIPEAAKDPKETEAATFEDVQRYLTALKEHPLARAAVALLAFTGARPGEGRGMRWEEWNREGRHIAINRSVWHREVGTPKTEKSARLVPVDDQLRDILLDLWHAQGCPIAGYILQGERKGHPVILDNLSKRVIRPALQKAKLAWKGFYALRRFHGTGVRMQSNDDTGSKALGNSKQVFNKHYLKPTEVLPDVRQAVNRAVSGLVQ